MRKVYKSLTQDQKARGVVFSSQLMPDNEPTIHEVLSTDDDKEQTIARLKDDKFFNSSEWNYNLIRK